MLKQNDLDFIVKKARNYAPSKRAFSCMRGKGCSKENCPAWVDMEWIMENKETHDKVITPLIGCQFILNPIFVADMISTTYRGMDRTNDVVKGYEESNSKLQLVVEESNKHTGVIKQGIVSLLKLVGTKDVSRILDENERLKEQLEEKKINQIEGDRDA
jgi:hypothetical protein